MKKLFLVTMFLFSFNRALAQSCEDLFESNVKSFVDFCHNQVCPYSTRGDLKTATRVDSSGTVELVLECHNYTCYEDAYLGASGTSQHFCSNSDAPMAAITPVLKIPTNRCGSIVQIENQVVGESVPIVGANFNMNYFTSWSQGRSGAYNIKVPISGASPRGSISSFDIITKLGSSTLDATSIPNTSPNLTYTFLWDGMESSVPTIGSRVFDITVTENRSTLNIPVPTKLAVGSMKSIAFGLGGWLPSVFNFYDIQSKKLYKGDGSIKSVEATSLNTGGFMVAESDGSRVYFFDSLGRHLSTKTGLTGTAIYTFSYDGNGNLSSISEPFSRTTTFERNLSDDFASITTPKGQVTTIGLDVNNFVSYFSNPNSETYSMTYSGIFGLLTTFTKPGAQVSTFTYDSDGNLTQDSHSGGYFFDLVRNSGAGYTSHVTVTTPMSRSSVFKSNFDSNSSFTSEVRPDSTQRTHDFNYNSGTVSETISEDSVVNYNYYQPDARFGVGVLFPTSLGYNSGSVYYSLTNAQSVTLSVPADPFSITSYSTTSQKGSNTVTTTYNPGTKVFSSVNSNGVTGLKGIDNYERIIKEGRGGLTPLEYLYTNENLAKIKQGVRETDLTYSSLTGFLTSMKDPLNQTTAFTYDSAGRLYSKITPDLRVFGYAYDGNGNLTGLTTPSSTVHSFTFNSGELLSGYAPPTLSGVSIVNTSYTYNNDKQLTQILKPTGETIDYDYDSNGNLQGVITPSGTYTVFMNTTNHLPGNLTVPAGPITYINYSGIRPNQISTYSSSYAFISGYSATFNPGGTLGSDKTDGSSGTSSINYGYRTDERLTTAGSLSLSYNTPNGMLTGTTLGTGSTGFSDAYTYNSFGEMVTYIAKRGTTTVYSLSIGRDAAGRINSKSEFMNTITNAFAYNFDASGRLSQTTKNSAVVATYGYDGNSNRNSGTIGAQTTTATYNDQDWMNAYNTLTFTYNANGDLGTRTNTTTNTTTTYSYDVFGNLSRVTLPTGTVIAYEVDALGRRIGKKVNGVVQKRWVYMDQTRIAAELNAAGAITKRFIYGSKPNIPDYMIVGSTNYRIISDHLGSPRLVVKQSDGSIAQRMNHDDYGRITEDTNPGYLPFGFAGGLYDHQTALVRFGARDYDPETGRWTSKDPILFDGRQTNLYGYVFNDPINFIDPSGLWGMTIGGSIGGFLGGGYDLSGGIYFGYQNGSFLGGLYGSGGTGFGVGAGVGVSGTYYPNACDISGASTAYNIQGGPVTGSLVTNQTTGAVTGYGAGIATPGKGVNMVFTNTGTIGVGP